MFYQHRVAAGQRLAKLLRLYTHRPDIVVLALPRGDVPVAAEVACQALRTAVDHIVCAETPQPFYAVGLWYQDFPQTSDREVRSLLQQARHRSLEMAARNP